MADWPASVPIQNVKVIYNENKAATESLFSRFRQSVTLDGGTSNRYEVAITTAPLTQAQMQTLFDFLIATGLYGTFTWDPKGWTNPASPSTITWVLTSSPEGNWDARGPRPITVTAVENL